MFSKLIFCLLVVIIQIVRMHTANGCDITRSSIICSGSKIGNSNLMELNQILRERYPKSYFLQVFISNTAITEIPKDTFSDITFENLLIDDNPRLASVDANAFAEQSCKTMFVINNPQLSDNALFQLSDKLNVYELIDFGFNGFKVCLLSNCFKLDCVLTKFFLFKQEIPSNAFSNFSKNALVSQTKKVKKLVLSNNQITMIGSNAFNQIDQCQEIDINQNKIDTISSYAFNLTTNSKSHISITLSNNQLTSESFVANFLLVNKSATVLLMLANNKITELKQSIFEPLLLSGNVSIDVQSNPINCELVKWITDNSQYKSKVIELNC